MVYYERNIDILDFSKYFTSSFKYSLKKNKFLKDKYLIFNSLIGNKSYSSILVLCSCFKQTFKFYNNFFTHNLSKPIKLKKNNYLLCCINKWFNHFSSLVILSFTNSLNQTDFLNLKLIRKLLNYITINSIIFIENEIYSIYSYENFKFFFYSFQFLNLFISTSVTIIKHYKNDILINIEKDILNFLKNNLMSNIIVLDNISTKKIYDFTIYNNFRGLLLNKYYLYNLKLNCLKEFNLRIKFLNCFKKNLINILITVASDYFFNTYSKSLEKSKCKLLYL